MKSSLSNRWLLTAGLLALCPSLTPAHAQVDGDIGEWIYNPGTTNWYYLTSPRSWQSGEDYAVSQGGHLVEITSQAEQDWIVDTYYKNILANTSGSLNSGIWTGLKQGPTSEADEPLSNWAWPSGTTLEDSLYTNWQMIPGFTKPDNSDSAGNGNEDAVLIHQEYISNFNGENQLGSWDDKRSARLFPALIERSDVFQPPAPVVDPLSDLTYARYDLTLAVKDSDANILTIEPPQIRVVAFYEEQAPHKPAYLQDKVYELYNIFPDRTMSFAVKADGFVDDLISDWTGEYPLFGINTDMTLAPSIGLGGIATFAESDNGVSIVDIEWDLVGELGLGIDFSLDSLIPKADLFQIPDSIRESLSEQRVTLSISPTVITGIVTQLPDGWDLPPGTYGILVELAEPTNFQANVDFEFQVSRSLISEDQLDEILVDNFDQVLSLFGVRHFTSATGTTEIYENLLTMLTGSPVWNTFDIETESSIDTIVFDATFLESTPGLGILSVYWDGNLIGVVSQEDLVDNSSSFVFDLLSEQEEGMHQLSIRLDPIDETLQSGVEISNIRLLDLLQFTPGDADGDGDIDDSDLGTAFSNYTGPLAAGTGGKTFAEGDTDGDGDVDDSDLGTAFSNYTGPIAVNIPEPASGLMLLMLGSLAARRRRRG